ncbi:flagellar motor protein MotB [Meridianimaribacter flavus]|jgi:chemotaxis protein MotB|uniref:Chemotaxis protein MotB n=1 Tax=Meridianimaribacter flavus TaxID=571115 RepID=A0ABY2G6R6_9FLAO|nr:OmpA family protein [Meridianimaribacter flavus]TDY12336.1 chemotaxis protein MotB [Meridianimaribacter flavus]
MKKTAIICFSALVLASCVSKKKYLALEQDNGELKSELTKTKVENEELEAKFAAIQARVDQYNTKINSLTKDNDSKLVNVDGVVMSENTKAQMRETLKSVPPAYLMGSKTLKDSMNAAISYNLKNSVDTIDESDDIAINIEETVVMISISDKMLFKSGSYKVSDKADAILQQIADVINSEESLDVMVEGHTDDKAMVQNASVKDNWDLSVLRATSVVKKLQNDFNIAPEKLIAAGRSFYQPIAANDTKENRAKNRRTRIVILPNLDKFFALMASN